MDRIATQVLEEVKQNSAASTSEEIVETVKEPNPKDYNKTFERKGIPIHYTSKPGRKVGALGKKVKIHLALDPDLHVIANNTGNRSRFISAAVRFFTETGGLRKYMAELEKSNKS